MRAGIRPLQCNPISGPLELRLLLGLPRGTRKMSKRVIRCDYCSESIEGGMWSFNSPQHQGISAYD